MQSHLNAYLSFCNNFNFRSFPLNVIVVSCYVSYLAHVGGRFGTIQNHISSLKSESMQKSTKIADSWQGSKNQNRSSFADW